MISCLIVNFNCLYHTKNLIKDIEKQEDVIYDITIYDQNSQEPGTKEFLEMIKDKYNVIQNGFNRPLNHIWNEFVSNSKYDLCAFLNNDIRIPYNFLKDTINIFAIEKEVSCVIHPTNHPNWNSTKPTLHYSVLRPRTRQGWDFSFRKSDWVDIPQILEFYCGDDFIFEMIYRNERKVAIALSSPIIHLLSQTRKSEFNKVIPNRNPNRDVENYKSLGFSHGLGVIDKYTKIQPEILEIIEVR